MATKKVGAYVKEARTAAKLTQEKLAQAAGEGLTANDIGKCERGEIDLTVNQLKKIAVACGVTQTSLVNAPKNLSAAAAKKAAAAKAAAAKTAAAKTSTAKKPAAKTTAAKKPAAKADAAKTAAAKKPAAKTGTTAAKKPEAAKKPATQTAAKKPAVPAAANTSMKVTTTEKKLVESYRGATSDQKKIALKVLKGDYGDKVIDILNLVGGTGSASTADNLGDALGNLLGGLLTGGK